MHLSLAATLITFASSAAAAAVAEPLGFTLFARAGLDDTKRQVCTVDEITPTSCQECFGQGSVNCLSDTCYNPTLGEQCCSNGNYCKAGTYCTNAGCCPDGSTLEQCGATVSLSVVPVPGSEPTSPPATATPSPISTPSTSVEATIPTATPTLSETTASSPVSTPVASPVASFTGAASHNNIISGGQGLLYGLLMVVGNLF